MVNELLKILCRQPILGYQKRLAAWTKKNADQLKIKITEVTWPKKLNLKCYDFLVELKSLDENIFGRGFSTINADSALSIAFAEAVERAVALSKPNRSTNGFATHFIKKLAKVYAYEELLERDAFFCHYLTRTTFKYLETHLIQKFLPNYFEACISNNLQLHLGGLHIADKKKRGVVACILNNQTQKMHIGASVKDNEAEAACNAFLEAFRNAVAIYEDETKDKHKSIEIFNMSNPTDHRRLYNEPGILEQSGFMNLFNKGPYTANCFYFEPRVTYQTETANNIYIDSSPFTTIRALSNDLQCAFWGPTKIEKINMKRLQSFLRKEIDFNEINLFPHPFD